MYVLAGDVGDRLFELPLKNGRHRIGRGARNDVDFEDLSVSREHAEIMVEDARVRIQDLGSSNGTWVNDVRVNESTDLHPGDEVRFGGLKFRLLEGTEVETDPEQRIIDSDSLMTAALLSDQTRITTQDTLGRAETSDSLRLISVFDQVLFRAVTEAGQLLILPRPLEEIFDQILRIVEHVIPARRILLLMSDSPEQEPVVRASRPSLAAAREQLVLSRTIIDSVLREQQALLLNDAQADPRFKNKESVIRQNIRCAMVAPLFDNERAIGLLYADTDDIRFHYDSSQLRAFTLLANLIAVKITNTRLLEAERERMRIEEEIDAAAQVQQALLAPAPPVVPGYEVMARQIPCYEVAGDLYDITQLDDGRISLVVGDVTGKGLGAAMLMSNTIAALRVLCQERLDLGALADRLHRQLLRAMQEFHFVTLFLGILDPKTHTFEYVNAGHNPPLLLCSETECLSLPSTGMPMGLLADSHFRVEKTTLPECCMLCVFTDGITEAMVDDELYGEERLLKSIRYRCHQPLPEIVEGVIGDLRTFLGEHVLQDDVTMLLLRRLP